MKKRLGFVTNSSSSNFLIALRDKHRLFLMGDVFDVFGVKLSSPLTEQLSKEVAAFLNAAEEVTAYYLAKIEDTWGEREVAEKAREFIENDWKVYHVYIDVNDIPMFRCLPVQSETKEVILWSLDKHWVNSNEN